MAQDKKSTGQQTKEKTVSSQSKAKQNQFFDRWYPYIKRYLPYIFVLIGIVIVFLFLSQRIAERYGQYCGGYTGEYAYIDDCVCVGMKAQVPTDQGQDTFEIKCLGVKKDCLRHYLVRRESVKVQCPR